MSRSKYSIIMPLCLDNINDDHASIAISSCRVCNHENRQVMAIEWNFKPKWIKMGFIYNKSFYRGNTKLKVVFRVVFAIFPFFSWLRVCLDPSQTLPCSCGGRRKWGEQNGCHSCGKSYWVYGSWNLTACLNLLSTKLQPSICGGHMHDVAKCGVEPNTPVVHCCWQGWEQGDFGFYSSCQRYSINMFSFNVPLNSKSLRALVNLSLVFICCKNVIQMIILVAFLYL